MRQSHFCGEPEQGDYLELRLILGRLETFASKVKEGLAEADWVTRRELIRTLVKRVEVDQEHVNVIFRVGPQTPSTPSDLHTQSLQYCGGVHSPVLANLALDGLERMLDEKYPKPKNGFNAKVNFVRFADDFIITGISKELLEDEIKPLVESFLKERGLELSSEKTFITHIEDGYDFLDQNVRKYKGKLLITPSKKNVQAFLEKIRGIIKDNKQATAGHLICQLNRVIRGWARYHRHVVSKETFNSIDRAIFLALWKWARRRHPRKGARWIRQKYFCTLGQRNWVFFGEVSHEVKTACSSIPTAIERYTAKVSP